MVNSLMCGMVTEADRVMNKCVTCKPDKPLNSISEYTCEQTLVHRERCLKYNIESIKQILISIL